MDTARTRGTSRLQSRPAGATISLLILGMLGLLAALRPTPQAFAAQPAPGVALSAYRGADPASWHEATIAGSGAGATLAAPQIVYSSYLGGNSDEEGKAIARDAAGNIYVTGRTYSTNFAGSPGPIAGSDDVFVAKFNPSGQLVYRTLIGGKSGDSGLGIAVNAAGEVAVTVTTTSIDFPMVSPLLGAKPEGNHGALIKLNAAGQLVFSTYLNVGFLGTQNHNIAFNPQGQIVFTGQDWAGATEGRENVGIYILQGDGSAAVWLGQFGGDWIDRGLALAVGPDGKIYIAGMTEFRDGGFPLSDNAFQKECGTKSYGATEPFCDEDAFVAVLNPAGNEILAATFLGGHGSEEVVDVGVDNSGNVYVAGRTYSTNFPTKNAFQGAWLGADNFSNGFITKFTPDLSAQLYSTFLGAQDQESTEFIYGMTLDGAGNVAVTGLTNGEYFPVKDAVQRELDGRICFASSERFCYDAFVSAFDPSGALTYSTYLGGDDDDIGYGIAGDGAGGFWVTGRTEANTFATTADAAQPSAMMQSDAFLTHLGTPGAQPGPGTDPQPTPRPDPSTLPFKAHLPLLHR